ncbi:flagellar biosynthesis anti-sigma factor FlgM [Youxingia wuxianensis]|uniref:Flagellar biosynthesis anti-sigma factor FlgM n=1 Tax=Youxingia wuxianensis TaxID=2763678 RepID=A0A926EQB7_9FIRM|nr:flagellar biosynthesis anti-sigma factor FlgM [Youxingia wuxianensis]MBC8585801.1 flagellar biosynthesis anti-sigma factor FlgM [Youxingia wuxianensis]
MKINPAAFHAYKKINGYTHASRHMEQTQEEMAAKTENSDQIQISPEGARKMEAEQLSRAIAAELCRPASPERLESLRKAIQDKSYHVPTTDLADAIMQHWCIA